MNIREEVLRIYNGEIHPETIYAKLAQVADRDTIHSHLCRMVEDGLLDAEIGDPAITTDGNLVSHVRMIYGRMDKRTIGFTA